MKWHEVFTPEFIQTLIMASLFIGSMCAVAVYFSWLMGRR